MEEKREKKSREKLIVVFFTHCPTLLCFALCIFLLSLTTHNYPTLLVFFPSSSLTRVGLGDMQRIL